MSPPPDSAWSSDEEQDRIDELFGAAYERSPADRARFLDEACADAPRLRAAVEQLLAAADEPLGVLSLAERGATPGSVLSVIPQRIGEVRVIDVLGRGGMGVVYRAEQEHPRRLIALKVLLPSDEGTDGVVRLHREAEILGRLQHPGIAQVFGAGSYQSALGKQPYLTMELIEGRPLVEYCAEQSLPVRARCELIAMVCDAVQHAHDRGVIHRDLKPSNVLVSSHGTDQVQPKVLDFGVARLIDPDQRRALTMQSGEVVGTLTYMSPEQFLHGQSSERSDVYSLGVMLYELLAGRLPFDFRGRSISEVQRLLAHVEPEPLPHASSVPTDLRTIVSRTLAKDPAERYPSAAELAADLRRWMSDEPIHARPITLVYQLRKFARRNRAFVIGLAATGAASLAGTVVALVLLVAARKAAAESSRNEYISQLRAASALWLTDPEEARHALDIVQDRAGLEWTLLAARLDPFVLTCPTGGGQPEDAERRAVAFSLDGKAMFFYVDTQDHLGHLCDASEGVELWRRALGEAPAYAREAVFSRSGGLLAIHDAAGPSRSLLVVRAADGEILQRVDLGASEASDSPPGTRGDLTFTADERFLVWRYPEGGPRGIGRARALNLSTGSQNDLGVYDQRLPITPDWEGPNVWRAHRARLSAETGAPLAVTLPDPPGYGIARVYAHPQGTYYACVRTHFNVLIHDASGEELLALNGLRARPRKAYLQGNLVAATTRDVGGGMRIWDVRSGSSVRGLATDAYEVAFDSDASRLLVVTAAGAGWIDLGSRMVGHEDFISAGALHPSGRLLATADTSGQIRIWNLDTATCCAVMDVGWDPRTHVSELAFDVDGRGLWCRSSENRKQVLVRRVDLSRWQAGPILEVGPQGLVEARQGLPRAMSWVRSHQGASITCSDGRRLSCDEIPTGGGTPGYEVVIPLPRGTQTIQRLTLADGPSPSSNAPVLAVDDDERWLAVGLQDGSLIVFDLESGQIRLSSRRHRGAVTGMLMLSEHRRLVTAGFDGTLRFWDMDDWREVFSEQGHERGIEGLVVTPDGSRIVTWSADRTVRIWDTQSPSERYKARQDEADARHAAEAWVDRAWDELGDRDLVGARIDAEVPPGSPRWAWVLERQLQRLAKVP